jgi:hypothetical protein
MLVESAISRAAAFVKVTSARDGGEISIGSGRHLTYDAARLPTTAILERESCETPTTCRTSERLEAFHSTLKLDRHSS